MFTILPGILVALLYLGVSQGAMPSATKSKYETYLKEFDNQRGQNPGNAQFEANKKGAILFMKSKFEAAGLTVHLQNFSSTDTNNGKAVNGTNLIAVLPGQAYKTAQDEVVVLAAHVDTYGTGAGGVNNDGTGLVGLLAIAEDLAGSKKCTLKNSIIFAAFDLSETGGSYTFCNRSCGSVEFLKNKATYIGSGKIKLAMVMDCIGSFDKSDKSQVFSQSMEKNFHNIVLEEALTDYWGDFLAITGRSDDGVYLQEFERFYKANKVQHDFRVLAFQWNIKGVPTSQNRSNLISGFKGGDHMSFWDADINTILLTDTCYNRGYMKDTCKDDKTCDTISKLSATRYEFMYSAVYSAMRVTKNLTCTGACAMCSPYADCKNNTCICRTGFTGNGVTCTAIPCASCSPYAVCQNDVCVCKAGYTGDGNTCKKVNSGSSLASPHQLLISTFVLLSLVVLLSNAFLYKTV
ncbi:uncharacterized protein LOC116290842 [Actinia tenebrosa]|uniref:Uncharacterized protein LOC116290842 n=1 Tax=Actinia tenebrosa TaxID=6105 RepID=A0A6P8HFQ7_ACTTE|nr:uncharacterized protein LOC116290842 [Actinia tenebrosa]